MPRPPLLRLAVAAVAGLAAAALAFTRVGEIEPYLEVTVQRESHSEAYDVWDLMILARGGETIDEVLVESQSPGLHVVGPGRMNDLHSGWQTVMRLQLDEGAKVPATVRVTQRARVERTYDVAVGVQP